MKQTKRFLVLTLLMSMLGLNAFAYDAQIDGIYYNFLSGNEASVAAKVYYDEQNSTAYSGDIVIPSSVEYNNQVYNVTSIDNYAFYHCGSLSSVTIPNSVTSIGISAFKACSGLTSIIIPNSVTSIGNNAFEGCSGLSSLVIPNSVTSIGYSAFYGCSGLTSVTISNSVTSIYTGVFQDCSGFASITIPSSVTSIGPNAFSGCSGLASITIPNSVTTIGINAFSDCSSLTTITIPNSVTSIGESAFYGCSGVTSIAVGSENAYYDSRNNCNAIIETATNKLIVGCKNTSIPNGVTSIDNYAFYHCGSLSSVTIPNSVTSIGISAFKACSGLTSIIIPNSVTSIGNNAFEGCSGLSSLVIPNSVTSIGYSAFYGCSSLTSVTIPNGVTSIGEYAFGDCSDLTSITIPSSVTSIGERAFSGCSCLNKVIINDIAAWCGFDFSSNNDNPLYYAKHLYSDENTEITGLEIPDGVTRIGNYAFSGCSYFTWIIIPNSVTSIGSGAFDGCSGINSVAAFNPTPVAISADVFPNRADVTLNVSLGSKAAYETADYWKDFKEIEEPTIYNIAFADANVKAVCVAHWDSNSDGEISSDEAAAVTSLSDYFKGNTSITSFDELEYFTGLTSIDWRAFYHCSSLVSVIIPNSITSIGEDAFSGCSSLTSITIPTSVNTIGNYALGDCNSLASIIVESGNTTFDSRNNCNAIIEKAINKLIAGCSSTIIPNNVTSIGQCAFAGSGLISITIPTSVTSIELCAFSGCNSLTTIEVESGNTVFDSRGNCNAIIKTSTNTLVVGCQNTIIPNSVTSIYRQAFNCCSSLTSITIPSSVTSIGNQAFYCCRGLTSITIPESVSSLEYGIFQGCSGLTSITIPNSVTSIGDRVFDDCNGLVSVTLLNPTPVAITSYTFSNRANAMLYVPYGCKDAYEAADYWKEFKEIVELPSNNITFADANVKAICVAHWDTNHDGEINLDEAAAVTTLSDYFKEKYITSFDELEYFTGLTSIDWRAFYHCSSLVSVIIPNSITSIGEDAFSGCSSLTSITIPISVNTIGNYALGDCNSLASIIVESGNTTFDSRNNCNAIIEKAINKLIAGCSSTIIPNNVTSIGQCAFAGSGLISITIPTSVTSIELYAFSGCNSLINIEVESGNTVYDSRENCNAIIKTSTNTLVVGCQNTVIPNSVTSIYRSSFNCNSSLTTITIPSSVTSIGNQAFYCCNGLKWVHLMRSESVTALSNTNVFYGCSSLSHIFVPENAGYETAENWSSFAAKMHADKVTMFEENAPNTLISWCDQFEYTKPAGCTVYGIGGVTGNQVNLTAIDGEVIPAYTPVIIQRTEGSLDAPIKAEINDIADGDDLVSSTAEGATLYGNTTEATITTGDFYTAGRSYVLYPGNKFLRVDTNEGIPAHRCMLTLSSPAATRSLSIGLGGDTTGLEELQNERHEEQEANNTWYDLQGRPIGGKPSVKGIYIYKGKKLVVK